MADNFSWQVGYGAFTVSKSNEEKVVQYINNQEKHHKKSSYKEELVLLLKMHGIQYDEKIYLVMTCFLPPLWGLFDFEYSRPTANAVG